MKAKKKATPKRFSVTTHLPNSVELSPRTTKNAVKFDIRKARKKLEHSIFPVAPWNGGPRAIKLMLGGGVGGRSPKSSKTILPEDGQLVDN